MSVGIDVSNLPTLRKSFDSVLKHIYDCSPVEHRQRKGTRALICFCSAVKLLERAPLRQRQDQVSREQKMMRARRRYWKIRDRSYELSPLTDNFTVNLVFFDNITEYQIVRNLEDRFQLGTKQNPNANPVFDVPNTFTRFLYKKKRHQDLADTAQPPQNVSGVSYHVLFVKEQLVSAKYSAFNSDTQLLYSTPVVFTTCSRTSTGRNQ